MAHRSGIPTLFTGANQPPPSGVFLPEAADLLADHSILERTTTNTGDMPEFVAAIVPIGRRHLILAGVALKIGVMFPALSAIPAGYAVSVVVDASGTRDPRIERVASPGWAQAGGYRWYRALRGGMALQNDWSVAAEREWMTLLRAALSTRHGP